MKIIQTKKEMLSWSSLKRNQGFTLGFVPTMGAFHEGHLSLIRAAKKECDLAIVSLFVNPLQFGPKEDFSVYPRDLKGDQDKAKKAGSDVLFIPKDQELFSKQFQSSVLVELLSKPLCGKFREGHFQGVTTVVTKLFHLVNPHVAFFGEKDFQQLTIIKQMVLDLDFPIRIVAMPTVREPDGLAMSSRNQTLSSENRKWAKRFPKTLFQAREMANQRSRSLPEILKWAKATLEEGGKISVEYLEAVDPNTLEEVSSLQDAKEILLASAVRVGKVRLIDHVLLGKKS